MRLRHPASISHSSLDRPSYHKAMLAAAALAALAVPAAAQLQFGELAKRGLPGQADHTWATAIGDVNGDGRLDLVVGNNDGQQSRLYLNNGDGTFTDVTPTHMPTGNYDTTSLVLGDVDGDGDLDLILGNQNQQSRLYLNIGNGTFTDATATNMPATSYNTRALALGDVDGDGDLDLIVGDFGRPSRLYQNMGNGTFMDVTGTNMPLGDHYNTSLALGDLDGDGDLDLVVGNQNEQSRLYLNNGTATFADVTATHLPAASYNTRALALGDLDGDGDLDLVVGNIGQSRMYLNSGAGSFTDVSFAVLPGAFGITRSLALGDVDGDGTIDLVIGNQDQQNRLYLNTGMGPFVDATATRLPAVTFNATTSHVVGDVDGDGDLDLVAGINGQSRLYLNSGTGPFTDVTATNMPVGDHQTTSLALGDVDGDGDLDLVLGNQNEQNNLHLNNGTGTFTDATATQMPVALDTTYSLAFGDLDGDGDLDLIVGNFIQQNRLYLNDGTGTFTDATATRLPGSPDFTTSLALGDVDGDGDLDLVVGNQFQQSRLYLNDGTGTFTDATATRLPIGLHNTRSLQLGDVDGDGDLDLVVGNIGQNLLYLNNGAGTFTDATASRLPIATDSTTSLGLGDVDGDGDLDLVVGNQKQQNRLHLNNGTGTFTDVTASRMSVDNHDTRSLVLGDMDGDGDLDLVAVNNGQSHIHLNLLRQLDAPFLLQAGRNHQLDVYSRGGPATQAEIAFPFLSTATASIPLPFGTVGIDPTQMIALPSFSISQPAGMGSLVFPVPNLPALAGITIYTQALLQQHPVQIRLTNVIGDVILR